MITTSTLTAPSTPQSEAQLQSRCVVWFKNTYPELRDNFYQIKNDGKKHKASASLDTAMGLTKGVPDTHLNIVRNGGTLYIEFKTLTGSLSKDQKRVIDNFRSQGHRVEVVRTEAQFRDLLTEYLT